MTCSCNSGSSSEASYSSRRGEADSLAMRRNQMSMGRGPYMGGENLFGSAVDAEADRIRMLGNGCAQMFYSDYMACRGVDMESFCRRSGMLYTSDSTARFTGLPQFGAALTRVPFRNVGSTAEVLRAADYLDVVDRIGGISYVEDETYVVPPAEVDWDIPLGYSAVGPDGGPGGYFGVFFDDDTPPENYGLGFGVLIEWAAKTGVSGPASGEFTIVLADWGFASGDTGVRNHVPARQPPPGTQGATGAPRPPAIPAVAYRVRFSIGVETRTFIPFYRAVANKGRATPAFFGTQAFLAQPLAEGDPLTHLYRVFTGRVGVLAPDVLTNVRATLIGIGSTQLPEALALLAVGKQVRP